MSRPSVVSSAVRVLGLALASLAVWTTASHATAPDSPAAPQGPARLAYVQETPRGSFELWLFDPAQKNSERVSVSADAPDLLVWRTDRPLLLSVGASSVYATPLGGKPYVSEPVGDPPPAGLSVQDGWVGADGKSFFVAGGLEAAKGRASCAVFQVPVTGAWRKVSEHAAQADGSCAAMIRAQRVTAFSVSSPTLMSAYTCAAPNGVCATIGDARYDAARRQVLRSTKAHENAAFADPLRQGGVYLGLGVQMGDTPHLMGPAQVFRHDGGAASPAVIKTATQVQVGVRGPFILLAEEYSGNNPLVLDARTGQILLSTRQARSAVWLPW